MNSPVLTIVAWNSWCSLCIGLCLNGLLFILAKCCANKDLKEYRKVVYYFCSLNTVALFAQALTQPIFLMGNDGRSFVYLVGVATWLPTLELRMASFGFFTLMVILMQAGLGFQFLDRYLHVCRSFEHWPKRAAIIGFLELLFVIESILFNITNYPSKDYEVSEIGSELGAELQPAHLKVVAEANMNLLADIVMLTCAVMLLLVYVLIVFCYLRIRAHVKRNLVGTTTASSQDIIRQISMNMFFQALLPMYAMGLYAVCIGIIMANKYSGNGSTQFALIAYVFVPVNWLAFLNPLVTIFTIRNYRAPLLAFFALKKMPTNVSSERMGKTTVIQPKVTFVQSK